jgi:hypothetical protein
VILIPCYLHKGYNIVGRRSFSSGAGGCYVQERRLVGFLVCMHWGIGPGVFGGCFQVLYHCIVSTSSGLVVGTGFA